MLHTVSTLANRRAVPEADRRRGFVRDLSGAEARSPPGRSAFFMYPLRLHDPAMHCFLTDAETALMAASLRRTPVCNPEYACMARSGLPDNRLGALLL